MMTVRRFNSLLLLALLTVSGSSSTKVVGRAGEDVTLSCKYDFKYNGPTEVCWGRGSIPLRGCNHQIISTDGSKVTTRASSRYQLLGRLEDGDVSLTILKTTEEDAGLYGCRVQISGWGNDEKHHIDLTIEKAPSTSSTPRTRTTAQSRQTEQTTNTSGQVTATESLPLSSNSSKAEPQQEDQEAGSTPVVLVCVLLALVTVGIVAFIGRRWNQHKIHQQQQQQHQQQQHQQQHQQQQQERLEQMYSPIQYSSDPPAVELQNQDPAIESIYQSDADGNGDAIYENHSAGNAGGDSDCVYEICP